MAKKQVSDLVNGLGPDQFYKNRLGTDVPILQFPRNTDGTFKEEITVESIQAAFRNQIKING